MIFIKQFVSLQRTHRPLVMILSKKLGSQHGYQMSSGSSWEKAETKLEKTKNFLICYILVKFLLWFYHVLIPFLWGFILAHNFYQ